jgi:DnaJ domain
MIISKSAICEPMATKKLTQKVESEISRLVAEYKYSELVLREFALLVLQKDSAKAKSTTKALSLTQLKQSIYQHFQVKDTTALKRLGSFQMATSGIDKLDLGKKATWEKLYRKLVGILPNEENEQGSSCINGIDIFKYDLPWRTFGLDPQTATTEDIKSAYRELSKVYHPDIPNTGDASIFDRLTVFYNSLSERF